MFIIDLYKRCAPGAVKSYMSKIRSNTAHTRSVLGLNYAVLSKFEFPVSTRHNALHGIPSLAAILSAMALHRSCGNEASKLAALEASKMVPFEGIDGIHSPTSQWALGVIGSIDDPDEMERRCGEALGLVLAALNAAGMLPESPVGAIDGHNMEHYGKKMEEKYTIRSKYKNGTTKFVAALTSAIVSGPYTIHTSARLLRRGRSRAEYVGDILDDNARRGIFCSHYVIDREAFNVSTMFKFGNRGDYFLMYARMTEGVKRALAAYEGGRRPAVSEYIVKSKRRRFAGTLVFWEKTEAREDGKSETVILPFFSNLPRQQLGNAIKKLQAELKKRQRIEVGYSSIERCMPMTTSNSPARRTFLFHYSLAAANLWVLADRLIGTGGRAGSRRPIERPPNPRFGSHSWLVKKKYNVTYREFCQLLLSEAARVIVMPKREQDEYAAGAAAKALQRASAGAEASAEDLAAHSARRAAVAVATGPLHGCL